ncbi:MAG: lysozyme inhibitor LprI family protein [Verrucomicrobiota bacterium]
MPISSLPRIAAVLVFSLLSPPTIRGEDLPYESAPAERLLDETYDRVWSQLSALEQGQLRKVQKAWMRFKEADELASAPLLSADGLDLYLAIMINQRTEMLMDLEGRIQDEDGEFRVEEGVRDAERAYLETDEELDQNYADMEQMADGELLKDAQRLWVSYRDSSAKFWKSMYRDGDQDILSLVLMTRLKEHRNALFRQHLNG